MPEPMFPDSESAPGGNIRGVIWNQPPELRGSKRLWTCRHTHYGAGDAVVCAQEEVRRRWVLEALGVPEGWDVHTVLNPGVGGHHGQLYRYVVDAPGSPGYYSSGYRFFTEKAALARGAAYAIDQARTDARLADAPDLPQAC